MSFNVAVNGYGRIGRNILRALYESEQGRDINLVAVNNRNDIHTAAHLTRYDTTHGRFGASVEVNGNCLVVNGERIRFLQSENPAVLPWGKLGVDVLLECTGKFNSRDKAQLHLEAGARKVLLSAPGTDVDATVVYGVNHSSLKPEHTVVSNASCTTNCLAPLVKVLHDSVGVEHGLITTVHSYTNDQVLVDTSHRDLRRGRSATSSIIPTKTGAAKAVGLVLPELAGKLHGHALRVPTINVSLVDLSFTASRPTDKQEIDAAVRDAADGELKGILEFSDQPLVSVDHNHSTASSIYDSLLTQVMEGTLVKVSAWYDNEWAYSHRMIDMARVLAGLR